MRGMLVLLVLCCIASAAHGLTLSNTLGSNMVLQREPAQAVIWGWETANSKIVVTIGTAQYAAASGTDGRFYVRFTHAAGGPFTITVNSSTGASTHLTNVLFGDVWLCGGQSNMQFTVHSAFNASIEIPLAAKYPQIRLFSVGLGTTSSTPLEQLNTTDLQWSVASPEIVGKADWSYFSAVCWFFGKNLANENPNLPIGLISSNWGGTYVQAWSSPDALAKCSTSPQRVAINTHGASISNAGPPANTPSVLWNAMIVPFLHNPIKGALWYQGESNAGDPVHYACQFPAMISDWRKKFSGGQNFTFLFVHLAPWAPGGVSIAQTRQAQLAAMALPNVGFATAIDLGDYTSPLGNIHPRNKQEVSERLLLAADAIAYGKSNVKWRAPQAAKAVVSSQGPKVQVTVTFEPNTLDGDLVVKQASCPAPADSCGWLTVTLSDKSSHNATATVNKQVLEISATVATGLTVKAVYYAWGAWPVCTLFDGRGLPVMPFEFTF